MTFLVEAPGTITEPRRSRRLQGLRPEFGLLIQFRKNQKMKSSDSMTEQNEETPTVPTYIPYNIPRNPSSYSGISCQDSCKWLKDYERISDFNRWDDSMRLANVVFYLTETARQWYENNEETLTSWEKFKTTFNETFSRTEDVQSQAEEILRFRAQRPTETSESYIQDVLELCRKVDPKMTEDQKVSHLMKGIADDLYQILLNREITNVTEFLAHCRKIEVLKKKRISKPRFERLPNVSAVSALGEEDLSVIIRKIVKEEIQRILPQISTIQEDEPETLETLIREEVHNTLAPLSREFVDTPDYKYVKRNKRTSWNRKQPKSYRPTNWTEERKTDLWRTSDNVPICFHCGRAGHVTKYCRDRRRIFESARSRRDTQSDSDSVSEREFETHTNRRQYRSNSPYPRQTNGRRQSNSPSRRTSRSPRRSLPEN